MRPLPLSENQSGVAERIMPSRQRYFHRAGDKETSGYRGGSFKGLDLCIGGDKCFGGVLIRAIQTPLERINGPSLVVDKILADCGEASVKDLVDRLPSLSCEDETSCLRVVRTKETSNLTVTCTARVGLSLRKFSDSSSRPLDFIARRYRFLTEVAKSKHKHLVAVELKKDGLSVEQISNRIGTSRRSVSRWLAQFDRGKSRSRVPNYVESFLNQNMDVAMVCELLGALS
mmetsp:Transcript_39084/g.154866  ORF Transcript_39084/g.154866 Transcript_39084/m.154866 type:complete len:230 (-) Transcript_39084:1834-2523(-)